MILTERDDNMPICTKEKIFNSLLNLLNNKKIENITIEEICKETEISRSTFYRNYKDKYEVFTWKFKKHMKELFFSTPTKQQYIENYILMSLIFVHDNKKYFKKLINYKGQNSFNNIMFDEICTKLKAQELKENNLNILPTESEYHIEMMVQSMIHAKTKWIKEDFIESPETIAKIIADFINRGKK